MEITRELIERYETGECTPDEEAAVARWLAATADQEPPMPMAENLKAGIWQTIANEAGLQKTPASTRRMYRLAIPRYVAAASIVFVGLFSGWYLLRQATDLGQASDPGQPKPLASTELGVLHITSKNKHIQVADAICSLEFDGYLQLINASSTAKTLVYGNDKPKAFVLQPGETYYLENVKGEAYLIAESSLSPADNYVRFVRGSFNVSCHAI